MPPFFQAAEKLATLVKETIPIWGGKGKMTKSLFETAASEAFKFHEVVPESVYEAAVKEAAPFIHNDPVAFGLGGEHGVFDIGNKSVLKIGKGPFVDIPNVPEILQPTNIFSGTTGEGREWHAFIVPKVQTAGVTMEHVKQLQGSLMDRGFVWADAKLRNVGFMGEKPIILDPGYITAMYKPEMAEAEVAHVAPKSYVAQEAVQTNTYSSRSILEDELVTNNVMMAGAGTDNSSMLNRSMRSNLGSRKTTTAL